MTKIIEDSKKIQEEEDITIEFFGCHCHDLSHTVSLSYFPPSKEDAEEMYFNNIIDPYRNGIWPSDSCNGFLSKNFWKDFYHWSIYKRFVIAFKYLFFKEYNDQEGLFASINFRYEDLERLYQTLNLFKIENKEEINKTQTELELESHSYKLKFRIEDFSDDDYFPSFLGTVFQFKKEKGFKKFWTALKYALGFKKSNYGDTDCFEFTSKDAKILKNIIIKIKDIALERIEKNPNCLSNKEKKIFIEMLDPDLKPVVLSEKDSKIFLEMLSSDKEPNEVLKEAAKRYKNFRI